MLVWFILLGHSSEGSLRVSGLPAPPDLLLDEGTGLFIHSHMTNLAHQCEVRLEDSPVIAQPAPQNSSDYQPRWMTPRYDPVP